MSWNDNLVNVIRNVIFADTELKNLMCIPASEQNNLVAFRDKYFVNEAMSDTLLFGEDVRIIYHEDEPMDTQSMNVMNTRIYFDIYVKRSRAYDDGEDRMVHRGNKIGTRLIKLLGGKKLHNINFVSRGTYDLTSRLEGYDRKTVVFSFKKIYG